VTAYSPPARHLYYLCLVSTSAAAMLIALTAWLAPAVAGDGWTPVAKVKPAAESAVRSVNYENDQPTRKLKWLPYRPTVPNHDEVLPAKYETPAVPDFPTRTAQRGPADPFNDPFGDRQTPLDSLQTPGALIDDTLREPEKLDEESLPGLPQADGIPQTDEDSDAQPDMDLPLKPPVSPDGMEGAYEGTLGEPYDQGRAALMDQCPSPEDLKSISELSTDIQAEDGDFPPECTLGEQTYEPRAWTPTCFTWKASGLCHKPLYFEEVHLERYGHSWGPFLQPVISGGHFFLTVPVLPYLMGLNPPSECMYTLGYYRPGSCAPYMLDPLPLSIRAALFEGGAWVGAVAAIP